VARGALAQAELLSVGTNPAHRSSRNIPARSHGRFTSRSGGHPAVRFPHGRCGCDASGHDRPCQRGELGGSPGRARHARRSAQMPVPALQDAAQGARRLVRGRAAHRLPAPAAQDPRPLGGPSRGQDRLQRLGGDLLRHPGGVPAPRRQSCARARRRRLRPATRSPCARGLPADHRAGQEITWGELHVGSRSIFVDARFAEVSHPTLRRVSMRIDC
jgi:hypothetical protein